MSFFNDDDDDDSDCVQDFGGSACGIYPALSYLEISGAKTIVLGVAPQKTYYEGSGTSMVAAENGCKCGPNCSCNPCTCK